MRVFRPSGYSSPKARPEVLLASPRHALSPICLAPVENRLNGNNATLCIASIDHAPITDSKSR